MIKDDISFVAEALFALCEPTPRPPRNWQFRPELLPDVPEKLLYQAILLAKGHEPLLEIECREIYNNAHLTPLQSMVLELRLKGWTFEEIGSRRGRSKQSAQNIFVQA